MIDTTITVDDSGVIRTLQKLQHIDFRKPLQRFRGYIVERLGHQIEVSSLTRGGSGRGIHWRPAAPHYTRKDGTVVPAHGGVAKVRGQGTVQGRLSRGKRTKQDAKFYEGFAKAPGRMIRRRISGKRLEIMLSKSPGLQHAHQLREFMQFQMPKDQAELERRLLSYVRGQIKKAKRG